MRIKERIVKERERKKEKFLKRWYFINLKRGFKTCVQSLDLSVKFFKTEVSRAQNNCQKQIIIKKRVTRNR